MKNTEVVEYAPPGDLSIFEASYLLNRKISKEAIVGTLMSLGFRNYFKIKMSDDIANNDFILSRDAVYPKKDVRFQGEGLLLASIYQNFDVDTVGLTEVAERIAMKGITLSELETITKNSLVEKGHIKARTIVQFENSYGMLFFLFLILILYVAVLPSLIRALTEANTLAQVNPDDYFLFPILLIPAFILFKVGLNRVKVTQHILTASGIGLLNKIKGFHVYLTIAEKDRVKFFQSTEAEHIKISELLPYAILFGIEKSWLKEVFVWKDEIHEKPFKIQ